MKGTVLPPIPRDENISIPKHVPIVNMVIDDRRHDQEEGQNDVGSKTYETIQLMPKTVSCDAETQTEKVERKGACLIM